MKSSDSQKRTRAIRQVPGSSVPATEAQNNFGRVLGRAKLEGRVFITRYDQPEAVVLSIQAYDALTGRDPVDLKALEDEFNAILLRMQRPQHGHAVDQLFTMTASQLGEAAVSQASARRRAPRGASQSHPQGEARGTRKAT